ncbi:MAG TPA: hypothetical protein DCW90_06470 [Lachnospiraceae bacterium]|nr:hypothetical protein [uncultured Lachnoclostridium sp.]HAU85143.1 hypothetical protein [Lachnospiraceae bacterium]
MKEVIGYNKNHEGREKHDFYATPPREVTNILKHEELIGKVLEPCCGMGHMVQGIIDSGFTGEIVATDLIDRDFGIANADFLSDEYQYGEGVGTVIMNPPFKFIEQFVTKALEVANDKVIMLARSQFSEGSNRYESIFTKNPPSRIYQYVDRIACAPGGDFENVKGSSMTYSWFVWDIKDESKDTYFKWIRRSDKQ